MNEEWRPVVGLEDDYAVSNHGRVMRLTATNKRPANSLMALAAHPLGRLEVGLTSGGVRHRAKVHRLVALAFLGEQPAPGMEVCHKNGDPTDNRVENLYWGTHSDNMRDSIKHGTNHHSRKQECKHGHPLDGANVRLEGNARICRTCDLRRTNEYRAKKRAAG